MSNFKSGLINCIGTAISIPSLVLLIIFSSAFTSPLYIVLYTLFGSFSFLFFLFSTLSNWIPSIKAQKVFTRFINIFETLSIFITCIILIFTNTSTTLKFTFLYLSLSITLVFIIFNSIWEKTPKTLQSILYTITYIGFLVFLFLLIFV